MIALALPFPFFSEATENEPNPLGYIRWSDAPKVEPKKK